MFFLFEVAWVHARLQVSAHEISPGLLGAARRFDEEMGQLLETVSARMSGKAAAPLAVVEAAYLAMKDQAVLAYGVELPVWVSFLLGMAARFAEAGTGLCQTMSDETG